MTISATDHDADDTSVSRSPSTADAAKISNGVVFFSTPAAWSLMNNPGYETAIYILEGRVQTHYGPGLRRSVINEERDFLFIPPDVPHQPVNLSATEPARAIVARNDPNEQESVLPYDPAKDV